MSKEMRAADSARTYRRRAEHNYAESVIVPADGTCAAT
jgi:hypothetical protein